MDPIQSKRLGATAFRPSKNKKWAVLYKKKWIHFGVTGMGDYTQHGDRDRQESYRRRHAALRLRDGLHGEGITSLLELALIVDLERHASSCRGGREIVCRLLGPAALRGSHRSLLLGLGALTVNLSRLL